MQTVEQKERPEPTAPHHTFSTRLTIGVLAFLVLIVLFPINRTANAYLTSRSIAIGSSLPGAITDHEFQFDAIGAPAIGSVVFEYCDSPLIGVPCVAPPGLDTSAPTLAVQTGETGFTVHPNTALTNNRIVIGRAPVASATGTSYYQFTNITNPATVGTTYYVRISTHASNDGTGAADDTGSVAFVTLQALTVNVYVPPYLAMCSGVSVAVDCTASTGDVVDLGELSKNSPNAGTTQFAVATNSFNGYTALLVGPTMTAGNRTIPALSTPAISQPGTSQFGINLVDNAAPNAGNNVDGSGTGFAAAGYNVPNSFRFQSGDIIARSNISTEWNRYTITYLVNVSDEQPAGRYSSTLTVIATTTF